MYQTRDRNQLKLLSKAELRFTKSWSHGGQKFEKRRKIKRPLVPGKTTHVIFKSEKAKGPLSLLAHDLAITRLVKRLARRHFVVIQDSVNMGNHFHLKVKFKDISHFQNFLRTFAALTARLITKAKKAQKFGRFWDGLVFTRVLHSAFEELGLKGYFEANRQERDRGSSARAKTLNDLNRFLKRLKSVRAVPQALAATVLELET